MTAIFVIQKLPGMDGRTNGPTDGPTGGRKRPVVKILSHVGKKREKEDEDMLLSVRKGRKGKKEMRSFVGN